VRNQLKELGGKAKPLNVTLSQEVERVQMVLVKIRKTLADLKLAIAGTIIMSPELATALNCLFDARIPPLWTKVSALEAPNLGVWFNAICLRCDQWTGWLTKGRPFSYWLAGFFNPQGFLTANRQEVCRAHQGWALDDVVDFTEVSKHEREDLKKPPPEGVYIYGMYLEGCKWDKGSNKLMDSDPKVLFAQLPCLLASGCLKSEKKLDANSYLCPVYKYKRRGSGAHGTFIFAADVRSEDKPMKWVLRGVALLATKD
jgi:dynein heavy chain